MTRPKPLEVAAEVRASPLTRGPAAKAEPRPYPACVEAERGILGAAMLDPRIVGRFGVVLAGKFYRHDHNELWSLLVAMMNADIPIEPVVSVPYEMQRLGPARFGGHAYVCCALIDAALPSASMAHYVGIVIDAARRRALIEACEVAADNACTSDDVGEVVARLLASLDGLVDV